MLRTRIRDVSMVVSTFIALFAYEKSCCLPTLMLDMCGRTSFLSAPPLPASTDEPPEIAWLDQVGR